MQRFGFGRCHFFELILQSNRCTIRIGFFRVDNFKCSLTGNLLRSIASVIILTNLFSASIAGFGNLSNRNDWYKSRSDLCRFEFSLLNFKGTATNFCILRLLLNQGGRSGREGAMRIVVKICLMAGQRMIRFMVAHLWVSKTFVHAVWQKLWQKLHLTFTFKLSLDRIFVNKLHSSQYPSATIKSLQNNVF